MNNVFLRLIPIALVLISCLLFEAGIAVDRADARSRAGGKSFSRTMPRQSPNTYQAPLSNQSGGFSRGLAGGLLGGALGGMLFGSMFGGHGGGMGILPILLLAGIGYFLYKRFSNRPPDGGNQGGGFPPFSSSGGDFGSSMPGSSGPPPPPPLGAIGSVAEGIAEIRRTDSGFDPKYFTEVASDVFFQVQAGWMRRDIQSYRHLLGEKLAHEYELQFEEMREQGRINKLENIAIRTIEVVDAGSDGREDFVTVLFTANLLDYTVDDKSGNLIEGSMTEPVKFEEEWTWARPTGTSAWKLEGIKLVGS